MARGTAGAGVAGKLRQVVEGWRPEHVNLWAVLPGGRVVSAKTQRFAGFVEEILRQQEADQAQLEREHALRRAG
jgi:hypothetical protein